MQKNHLCVLYAADNNYAPFCGVSIFSLLMNNKDIENITVYVVLDAVSEDNTNRLKKLVSDFNRELIIREASEFNSLMKQLGVPKYRGTYATHFRKFFHLIVKDDVERLLYIDSDSIVSGSLKSLLNFDLGDAVAGVVLDALLPKYKLLLGFDQEEPYFNAGVTLIDVNNWKKMNITNALMNHIKNERNKYCNPDQDLFNIVLKGKTKIIPLEYNFMPIHRLCSVEEYGKLIGYENYYTPKQVENALKKPVIIHCYRFLGEFPWHKGNQHPDTYIFDEYMKKSPWGDYVKKTSCNTNLKFKIERFAFRFLPRMLFLKLFLDILYSSFYKKEMKFKKEFSKRRYDNVN